MHTFDGRRAHLFQTGMKSFTAFATFCEFSPWELALRTDRCYRMFKTVIREYYVNCIIVQLSIRFSVPTLMLY